MPILKAVRWALDMAFDLWNVGITHSRVSKPKIQAHWRPPDDGLVKINVDRAFNASAFEGATGAIAAETNWYPHAATTLAMEANVARNGLALAREHGFQRIIIESDSQVLTKLWKEDKFDRSEVASILTDIKELSRGFSYFSLCFVRRTGNVAAHLCAQNCVENRQRCTWTVSAPDFISNCLSDCNPAALE